MQLTPAVFIRSNHVRWHPGVVSMKRGLGNEGQKEYSYKNGTVYIAYTCYDPS